MVWFVVGLRRVRFFDDIRGGDATKRGVTGTPHLPPTENTPTAPSLRVLRASTVKLMCALTKTNVRTTTNTKPQPHPEGPGKRSIKNVLPKPLQH